MWVSKKNEADEETDVSNARKHIFSSINANVFFFLAR